MYSCLILVHKAGPCIFVPAREVCEQQTVSDNPSTVVHLYPRGQGESFEHVTSVLAFVRNGVFLSQGLNAISYRKTTL